MHILLVEDDDRVASFIRRGLSEEGFSVDVAQNGEEGLYLAQTGHYDAVILDILLPKLTGTEVLESLRQADNRTPVLILSAKDELDDRISGLNLGADDYLTKPFSFEELLARIRALGRRSFSETVGATFSVGDLVLDPVRHQVHRASVPILLSPREYSLLLYFLRHANQLVTRAMLIEHVWEHDFDSFSNVIEVHIARLRRKIDKDFETPLLHTVRGWGYVLKDPTEECVSR